MGNVLRAILFFLSLCLLSACDDWLTGEPDLRRYVPTGFSLTASAYSKALTFPPCVAGVFLLEDDFEKNFSEDLLTSATEVGEIENFYEPWQKTPAYKNIYLMAKATSTLGEGGRACLADDPIYLKLFKKYADEEGAYFTWGSGGEILFYLPNENVLIFAKWS